MGATGKPPAGGLQPPTREPAVVQLSIFGGEWDEPAWRSEWWGMPEFHMGDATPQYRVTINCLTLEDVVELGRRIGTKLNGRSDTAWFPRQDVDEPKEWAYVDA